MFFSVYNFYEKNDRWIERHYADDKERNSMPFKRHVYNALAIKAKNANDLNAKFYYFVFSLLIILPGLYYLITSGLKLGIDFTGGALLEYSFEKNVNLDEFQESEFKQTEKQGFITELKDQIKNVLWGTTNEDFSMPKNEWLWFVGFIQGRNVVPKQFQTPDFGAYSRYLLDLMGD